MLTICVEINGETLQVPADVTLNVPATLVQSDVDANGVSPVKLWLMNTVTGRWLVESDLVADVASGMDQQPGEIQRFTTTIKGIPMTQRWYNFDVISRRTCYSKVRVFEAGSENQLHNAEVGVLVARGIPQNSVSYVRAYTDRGDFNGYCVAHPCDNELQLPGSASADTTGIIFAQVFGEDARPLSKSQVRWTERTLVDELEYEADNDTIQVKLNLRPNDTMGPFYSAGTKLL